MARAGLEEDALSFSIRELTYFVAVAEASSISAAARDLYVSQSAVTTAVQQIEQKLKTSVLERNSRGVKLTPTGRALLPKARQILQMLEDATSVAVDESNVVGAIRVGVSYTVMAYFLPHHIQQLAVLYPSLKIEWIEMGRAAIEESILDSSIDFGLLLTSNVRNPDLTLETFVHSTRRLWLPPGHPLTQVEEVRLDDIRAYPYALLTVDEGDRTTRRYFSGVDASVFIRSSSIEAIRSIVANGNAVTILSDMVYRPWSLEGRRIETKNISDEIADMCTGLAWARGKVFPPTMTALHDYFYRQFCTPNL